MVLKAVDGVHASTFPQVLIKLICRCAKDHPYHALPIILALANSDADQAEIEAGKILLNRHVLVYSIYVNSFSSIPYCKIIEIAF